MFFNPELLVSRESGFGLLWLAATLGSKSTFKKLPKRSILTADISRLCDLISEPSEPLALRLSSNLLVGVARYLFRTISYFLSSQPATWKFSVYKVKQELFFNDVTNCFAALKKMARELEAATLIDTELQMAQTSVRPSTITLAVNPRTTVSMDFESMVADWDEYLNIIEHHAMGHLDAEDLPASTKASIDPASLFTEKGRGGLHTLTEHHEHLLSTSFDFSFHSSGQGVLDSPSSQIANMEFDMNVFGFSDGLDTGISDELARELGWETPVAGENELSNHFFEDNDIDVMPIDAPDMQNIQVENSDIRNTLQDKSPDLNRASESIVAPVPSHVSTLASHSTSESFSRLFLSQHEECVPAENISEEQQAGIKIRAKKIIRLLMDARIELTDDELKCARAQYLRCQWVLRRNFARKRLEKHRGRILEEKLWGVPSSIYAPTLVNFWKENLKKQINARVGGLSDRFKCQQHLDEKACSVAHVPLVDDNPPRKRRKITEDKDNEPDISTQELASVIPEDLECAGERSLFELQNLHYSSEEPGQGRQVSRGLSPYDYFGLDLSLGEPVPGSHKSSLFPWDNAGGISSSGMPSSLPSVHLVDIDHANGRARGSSQARRDSSLVPSQLSSLVGGSAAIVKPPSQGLDEDYAFQVDASWPTLDPETNMKNLEKNSLDFLEYLRIQAHSLSPPTGFLSFETIVPRLTSTRRIAASAFYHCLGARHSSSSL